MIAVKNLTKKFGNLVAVDGISLEIPAGTLFGLLGPNGAGKTTFIRMLTGLIKPTSGTIRLNQTDILKADYRWKSEIGVVSHELALFEGLTVMDQIRMLGPVYGLAQDAVLSRGEELLRLFDLWDNRDLYVNECSYGMQKKLALALGLIHNPKIMFLDEALAGIDPVTGSLIRKLLKRLAQKGVTCIITSHTLDVMETLVDAYAIISRGTIVAESTKSELEKSGKSLEEVYIAAVGEGKKLPGLAWLF